MSLASGSTSTSSQQSSAGGGGAAANSAETNTVMERSTAARPAATPQHETAPIEAVERALATAVDDAGRIGELLDVLRTARLWLPLPDDGSRVITGSAVTLPTVSYLGCDFVPAYSSAELMLRLTHPDQPEQSPATVPHAVVRAADLARLLPISVGIALNAGASESVPIYPPGVSYLAAEDAADDSSRISVGPLPVRPEALLADIGSGLARIPAACEAAAAWLSVQNAGEGLLISVTLDDPGDASVQDAAAAVVERAAWRANPDEAGFPIDVTFPADGTPDAIDESVSAFGTPFYRRYAGQAAST